MFPPLLCLLLLLGLLLCFPLGVFPLPAVKRCRQDLWVPSRFMCKIVCRLRLNEVSRQ